VSAKAIIGTARMPKKFHVSMLKEITTTEMVASRVFQIVAHVASGL